jgi:hypothetical protein
LPSTRGWLGNVFGLCQRVTRVRVIALHSTMGVARSHPVVDTGGPVTVSVDDQRSAV